MTQTSLCLVIVSSVQYACCRLVYSRPTIVGRPKVPPSTLLVADVHVQEYATCGRSAISFRLSASVVFS
jgi:hypothetical protein